MSSQSICRHVVADAAFFRMASSLGSMSVCSLKVTVALLVVLSIVSTSLSTPTDDNRHRIKRSMILPSVTPSPEARPIIMLWLSETECNNTLTDKKFDLNDVAGRSVCSWNYYCHCTTRSTGDPLCTIASKCTNNKPPTVTPRRRGQEDMCRRDLQCETVTLSVFISRYISEQECDESKLEEFPAGCAVVRPE